MIIDGLRLKNFISHTDTGVEFSGGINVILGQNGAGKSSLMDAIRFALFGDSSRGTNSDLIHHGSDSALVDLSFHINEESFEIIRKITVTKGDDTKTDAEMRLNGELYANGAKAVNSAVESLFRISREMFFSSIFVKQGEIDQLVSEKPADRKKLFSQIIGIDELEKKADILKNIEKRIRSVGQEYAVNADDLKQKNDNVVARKKEHSDLAASAGKDSREIEKLSESLEQLRKAMDDARAEFLRSKQKIETLELKRRDSTALEKEASFVRDKMKQYAEAAAEYARIEENENYRNRDLIRSVISDMREATLLTSQIRDLAKKLRELKVLREKRDSLSEAYNGYKEAKERLEKLEESSAYIRKAAEQYRAALHEKQRKDEAANGIRKKAQDAAQNIPEELRSLSRDSLAELLSGLNERKNSISTAAGSMDAKIEALDSSAKDTGNRMEMLTGESVCPVCGSDLTPDHLNRVLHEYESGMKEMKEKKLSLVNDRKRMEEESLQIQHKIEVIGSRNVVEYLALNERLKQAEIDLRSLEKELEAGSEQYGKFIEQEKEAEELKKSLKGLETKFGEYSSTEAAIKVLEAENPLERIEKLKEERNPVEQRFMNNISSAGLSEDSLTEAMAGITGMEKRISELRPAMESMGKLEASLREVEVKLKSVSSEITGLEKEAGEIGNLEHTYHESEREVSETEKEYLEVRSRVDSARGTLRQMESDISQRESEIVLLNRKMEKYSKIVEAAGSISEIRAALDKDGIQKYLRKESSEAITSKTRGLVSEFGLEIDDIMVSEDFDVEVSVGGAVESLSALSGGEKTALAIALRMSVADYVLSRISTFIMDEPTTFLDEDRRGQLKNILQNSLRDQSIVPQLIVITHHQELTKAADTVYWVTKENGSSRVEPVE